MIRFTWHRFRLPWRFERDPPDMARGYVWADARIPILDNDLHVVKLFGYARKKVRLE